MRYSVSCYDSRSILSVVIMTMYGNVRCQEHGMHWSCTNRMTIEPITVVASQQCREPYALVSLRVAQGYTGVAVSARRDADSSY